VRELVLLRRDGRAAAAPDPVEAGSPAEAHEALHAAACAVEQDEALAAEMADWDEATVADGLARRRCGPPKRPTVVRPAPAP
jgi:hypothetical protein